MGTVQHKYTHEYFTGLRADGSAGDYGVEGYASYLGGSVRAQDLKILERIDFSRKRVLEFGFGRGEAMKYALEHGAAHYEGVDFAPAAHELAVKLLQQHDLPLPTLHNGDAILFLKERAPAIKVSEEKFDIVLMLDFVEHVPRSELSFIFTLLHDALYDNAVIVINTPYFLFDNDIFTDEVNYQNNDLADLLSETQGMHCNKYTLASLHQFMRAHNYEAISEGHFFIQRQITLFPQMKSYAEAWSDAKSQGSPLLEYAEDDLEMSPAEHTVTPPIHTFTEGRMAGLSLYLAEHYKKTFEHGDYDGELFSSFIKLAPASSTVFDLGGFMGVSSLLFARYTGEGGRVYCFEPNPYNANRIRKNLSLNPAESKKIRVLPFAVGNQNTNTTFLLSRMVDDGRSSTSQLMNAHCTLPRSELYDLGFYEQSVQLVRLDDFVAESGAVPDVIKVDIEGAEHFFLEGAFETLKKHHPVLFIELHSPYCAMKCTELLDRLGYSMCVLHEESDNRLMVVCIHQDCLHSSCTISFEKLLGKNRLDELQCLNRKLSQALDNTKSHIAELSTYKKLYTDLNDARKHALTELTNLQATLVATQAELVTTQAAFADAQRVLNKPIIRTQRKLWRLIKFWK